MSKWVALTLGLLVLAGAAGGAWWWHASRGPERQFQRGLTALQRGEPEEALRVADVLDEDGASAHAALLRAEVLFAQARPFLGSEDKSAAVPVMRAALREIRTANEEPSLQVDAAVIAGQCLFYLGNLHAAEGALRYVLSERPDQIDVHRALAALYYDLGANVSAVEHLREVARLDPNDGQPHRLMGLIHKFMDKFPEAAAHYEDALRRYLPGRKWEEAQVELAEVEIRLSRFDRALAALDRLDREAAAQEVATILRAEAIAGDAPPARAQAVLDEALRRYPRAARLLQLQAELLTRQGNPEKAVLSLEKAVQLAPRDATARYKLGQLYRRLGRAADAKEQDRLMEETRQMLVKVNALTHRASTEPWDPRVRRELADLFRQMGPPELEKMWRKAADACPPAPGEPPPKK